MNDIPKGLRLHIALFGRRNVGKSSLLNALCGQAVAIVSPTPGTTTDPVEKTMELSPLGPVVLVDTAGVDDTGALGGLRAVRSRDILLRTDVALLVTDSPEWGVWERDMAALLQARGIPFVIVRNKVDIDAQADAVARPADVDVAVPYIAASAQSGRGLEAIRRALEALIPASEGRERPLLHDLVPEQGMVLLVVPLDSGAPKGRLILPQVQAIRDSLDGRALCMICTEAELAAALERLRGAPDLVVCDSQVVHTVAAGIPAQVPLTTFSVLMARFKGDLCALARGAAALSQLKPGDTVVIQEACSHHPQKEDIGRVKLPRLLQRLAGGPVHCPMQAGKEFPTYDTPCTAVVHCGACVITHGQMLARQRAAAEAQRPMTNYGLAISLAQGVLPRVLEPFPEALAAFEDACAAANVVSNNAD